MIDETHLLADLQTQGAEHAEHDRILVRGKEQQISRLSIHGGNERFQFLLRHELRKGRLVRSIRQHTQIRQTSRTVALGKINQRIDLLSRHLRLSFGIDTAHGTA